MQTRLGLMGLMVCGVLSLLVGTASPTPTDDAYRRGLDASNRQDYATALREWQPLAQQGYAPAQSALGRMYEHGRGVTRSGAEAVKWYRKAADQGDASGQNNLGSMYERGQGVTQDRAEAQRWYAKAAEAFSPGYARNDAIEARERIARQRATAQLPAPSPVPSPPASAPAAQPPNRCALVIGNAAYLDSPLANPVNDATDLSTLLRRLGFDTTLHANADKPTMEKAVDLFTRGVPRGSAGLFFFAGHGVQIDGVNYLLPIGAQLDAASDVKYHAVAADWVLAGWTRVGWT